jgi:group II intron reverse transcriptase/maturase
MNVQETNWNVIWKRLPWKKFQLNLYRLQQRIFRNSQQGNYRRAKQLQRFLLKSQSAIYLAVRQVTQLNTGKKTAGVDGLDSLSPKQRIELAKELLRRGLDWKHSGLRKIPIPKADGTQRELHVPTIADRAYQCLLRYGLEPMHEAHFHKNSYGFRPGYSVHDAIEALFKKLSGGTNKERWILDGDIEKCFDRIDPEYLESRLICDRKMKQSIRGILRAGVEPEFTPTEIGVPQGGCISPLLANIALNGIEIDQMVRYADDFACVFHTQEAAEIEKNRLDAELAKRGLKIKEAKTQIVKSSQGFNFLGHHLKLYPDNTFRISPSKNSIDNLLRKTKAIFRRAKHLGWNALTRRLNPILRGWWNFYRFCGNRSLSDGRILRTLKVNIYRWYRSKRGKTAKHFARFWEKYGSKLVTTGNCPTARWIKIQAHRSFFDGDVVYWAKRNKSLYDAHTAKALKRQDFKCGHCGLTLIPGEKIELHHIDGNHDNWRSSNLMALHRSCHQNQDTHVSSRPGTTAGAV